MRFTVFQSIRDRTVKNINKYFLYSCIYNVYGEKKLFKRPIYFSFYFCWEWEIFTALVHYTFDDVATFTHLVSHENPENTT